MIRSLLRRLYLAVQALLKRAGYFFVVTRISDRNVPDLINRAVWKPFVTDDDWRSLYKTSQEIAGGNSTDNTARQFRFYSTFQLADYAARLPAGDVVECGCWHGHTTVAIATILARRGFGGRFHVFDSFEGGLSPFTAKDESSFELSEAEKAGLVMQFASDFERVKAVVAEFGFVDLHRGWIPQSFTSFEARPIRFVHVDVDMYEPTKACLELFWDWLVPGGCIAVDDYNHTVFEGATRAVHEFLAGKAPRLFYSVPFGSCFIIK